jgi:hypothetical protein
MGELNDNRRGCRGHEKRLAGIPERGRECLIVCPEQDIADRNAWKAENEIQQLLQVCLRLHPPSKAPQGPTARRLRPRRRN